MKRPYIIFFFSLFFLYLFYHFHAGLNVFAFDAVLLLVALRLRPELARQESFRWAVAALLPSALAVVIVHSTYSLIAHAVSMLLLMGFAQLRELRFVWFAVLLGLSAYVAAPIRAVRRFSLRGDASDQRLTYTLRWLRQAGFPLLLLLPFLLLYTSGNGAFGQTLAYLSGLFKVSELPLLQWIFLLLLGALAVLPLLYYGDHLGLATRMASLSDRLHRRRRRPTPGKITTPLSLKKEYRRGVLTLMLLNLLLLLVNLTDIRYVWQPSMVYSAATLSEYVHQGTSNLVISILLAMAVVLYYYRGNLNFYAATRPLRWLTYAWLAQNAFLGLSVGVRNYHYIASFGLAQGRINVVFGLLLILVGLFTLYRKVRLRLSLSFLLQTNGISAWLFLIAFGAVNWTGVMTRVNLRQSPDRIDWKYLVRELDHTNIYLLVQHAASMPPVEQKHLGRKEATARNVAATVADWRYWNYADWRAVTALPAPQADH